MPDTTPNQAKPSRPLESSGRCAFAIVIALTALVIWGSMAVMSISEGDGGKIVISCLATLTFAMGLFGASRDFLRERPGQEVPARR
jgi:hypothetical protein